MQNQDRTHVHPAMLVLNKSPHKRDTHREMATRTMTDRNKDLSQKPVSTPQAEPADTLPGNSMASNVRTLASNLETVTIPTHVKPPNVTRVQNEPTVNVSYEADIQTAQTLLELHETQGLPENNLMADYDNSEIMPVNAPPVPDYSKKLPVARIKRQK